VSTSAVAPGCAVLRRLADWYSKSAIVQRDCPIGLSVDKVGLPLSVSERN